MLRLSILFGTTLVLVNTVYGLIIGSSFVPLVTFSQCIINLNLVCLSYRSLSALSVSLRLKPKDIFSFDAHMLVHSDILVPADFLGFAIWWETLLIRFQLDTKGPRLFTLVTLILCHIWNVSNKSIFLIYTVRSSRYVMSYLHWFWLVTRDWCFCWFSPLSI